MSSSNNVPASRIANKNQSSLTVHPLTEPSNLDAFENLYNLFAKCFGPSSGQLVFTHNESNIVTASSSCARILATLPVDDQPLIKLITTAIQGHVNNFTDAGIQCGLLACALIKSALKLDFNRHLICNIYEVLLEECTTWLASKTCPAKIKLDFASTSDLQKLVKNIIGSKPGSSLSKEDINHISLLILTLFINSIGEADVPKLHTILLEGKHPSQSEIHDGFLLSAYDFTDKIPGEVRCKTVHRKGQEVIKTALIGLSMAGDSDSFVEGQYEVYGGVRKRDVVLGELGKLVEGLERQGVGLLLCQKVVHENIKAMLRKKGLVVVERLGLKAAHAAEKLSGGALVHAIDTPPRNDQYGYVKSVKHVVVQDRSYVELVAVEEGRQLGTLILCNGHEESLDEVKVCCEQAQEVLQQCLRQPHALVGGGCWLTVMAHHIKQQLQSKLSSWTDLLECFPYQIQSTTRAFITSLHQVAASLKRHHQHYVDKGYHHHWSVPPGKDMEGSCECGAMKYQDTMALIPFEELILPNFNSLTLKPDTKEIGSTKTAAQKPLMARKMNIYSRHAFEDEEDNEVNIGMNVEVLDGYTAFYHSFQTAVLTANMVLSVGNVVMDAN